MWGQVSHSVSLANFSVHKNRMISSGNGELCTITSSQWTNCQHSNQMSSSTLWLVHTGWMSGDIGRFNKNRPTIGPCVCQPVQQKPFGRLLSEEHAGKPAANRLPTTKRAECAAQWGEIAILTSDRWYSGSPLVCTRLKYSSSAG